MSEYHRHSGSRSQRGHAARPRIFTSRLGLEHRSGDNQNESRDRSTDKSSRSDKDRHTPKRMSSSKSPRKFHSRLETGSSKKHSRELSDKTDKKLENKKEKAKFTDSRPRLENPKRTEKPIQSHRGHEKEQNPRRYNLSSRKGVSDKAEIKSVSNQHSEKKENPGSHSRSDEKRKDWKHTEKTSMSHHSDKHDNQSLVKEIRVASKERSLPEQRRHNRDRGYSRDRRQEHGKFQNRTLPTGFARKQENERHSQQLEHRYQSTSEFRAPYPEERRYRSKHNVGILLNQRSDVYDGNNITDRAGRADFNDRGDMIERARSFDVHDRNDISDRDSFPGKTFNDPDNELRKEYEQNIYNSGGHFDEEIKQRRFSESDERYGGELYQERRHENSYRGNSWDRDNTEPASLEDGRRQKYGKQWDYKERDKRTNKYDRRSNELGFRGFLDQSDKFLIEENSKNQLHNRKRRYKQTSYGHDSERHYDEGDYEKLDLGHIYDIKHNDFERSPSLKTGRREYALENKESNDMTHDHGQNKYRSTERTENQDLGSSRCLGQNRTQTHQIKARGFRRQNLLSKNLQHYRNTKRKIITNRFRKPYRTRNVISTISRKTIDKDDRNESRYQQKSAESGKKGGLKSTSDDGQQLDRPKLKPHIDRGASGCLLKEDRPYEERQNEGFIVHMDPPFKRAAATARETKRDKNVEAFRQPMIFIPNQDIQHGSRQTLDQFGNIINLHEVPQGGLTPMAIQTSSGQEMIFIPFGGNTVLPENIIPIQQGNFPIGFVPQFIPPNHIQSTSADIPGTSTNMKETSKAKAENEKAPNKKPLSSEQRAKMRSKLMQRRKQNLVKEVEKKVLENLDRKSMDDKMKGTKQSESREKENTWVSPEKIAKKDPLGQNIYDDVSDLEDVSEDENEHLSDWENVSVDEIELDANERRPKFRKQNEPRVFIQHSLIKRKLHVRRAPAQTFGKSKSNTETGQEQGKENTDCKKPRMHGEDRANISQNKISVKENQAYNIKTGMYGDEISGVNESNASSDKHVFKAYTASRVSGEIKRIDLEERLQSKTIPPVKDRISNNEDRRTSGLHEPRAMSPLQVTVKNNLYERKENEREIRSHKINEFREEKLERQDKDLWKRASNRRNILDRDIKRHAVSGNKSSMIIPRRENERFEITTGSDTRIIQERGQSDQFDITSQREDNLTNRGRKEEENEQSHKVIQRGAWNWESKRTKEGSRDGSYKNKSMENKYNQRSAQTFNPAQKGERYRNTGTDELFKRDEMVEIDISRQRNDGTRALRQDEGLRNKIGREDFHRNYRKPVAGFKITKDESVGTKLGPGRAESYLKGRDGTAQRHRQEERFNSRDDFSHTTNRHSEHRLKRGLSKPQNKDKNDENISRRQMINFDAEQEFENEMANRGREGSFDDRVESVFSGSDDLPYSQQGSSKDKFDPSLPTLQNVPSVNTAPVSLLPDMSLPPPQMMGTRFMSTSQVMIQNPPLLGQSSQVQNIQQPQMIELHQSQPLHSLQNSQNIQHQTLTFQPQSAGHQQSFQQQTSQQSNLGLIQQQPSNRQIQFQSHSQQPQQRSYPVLIDNNQPLAQQLSLGQQQNISSQQQQPIQQILHSNVQSSQPGCAVSYSSQLPNLNQPVSTASPQQQQSRDVMRQNPFQNVQQTLRTLGLNQELGMPARIVGIGQRQNVGGQAQGFLVPASFSGSLQGYNKGQF